MSNYNGNNDVIVVVTYVHVYVVVRHPVKNIVSDIVPGLIGAEDDEEGEERGEGGDDGQNADHLHRHAVRQWHVPDIFHREKKTFWHFHFYKVVVALLFMIKRGCYFRWMCWRCSPRHVPTRTESAGPTTARFIPSKCPPGICWGHPSQQPRTGPPVHLILHLAVVVLTFELSFGFKRALSNVVLVVWGIITTIILFGNMSNCCQTAKLSTRWREQGAHLKSRSYTEVIRVMLVLNRPNQQRESIEISHVHISFL